ncbi:MAG: hypothetical protein H6577_20040 [Lewinellaceae bacterium]|nr:hypothetical protein [Saprospiraceae bacterium]MCB9340421.1 hypothetical protein [Lewinellaceae bacterium]
MKKLLTLLVISLPAASFAHGGHGLFDPNTLMHYVGTPEHALPILAIAAVVGWLLFRRKQRVHNS